MVVDKIVIRPFNGIEPRVLLTIHGDHIKYGDVIRKIFVQPEHQVEVPRLGDVYMEKELCCMHMRVGPPAPHDLDFRFQDPGKLCFYDQLNAIVLRQLLPSAVVGATIGDVKKVTQVFFAKIGGIWRLSDANQLRFCLWIIGTADRVSSRS